MTDTVSPFLRKFVALTLLLCVLWLAATGLFSAALARIALEHENRLLRDRADMLSSRRINIASLRTQLRELARSSSYRAAVIVAGNERAAVSVFQRSIRETFDSSQSKLLSLTEERNSAPKFTIVVRVRARLQESALPSLIQRLEQLPPHLSIDDLSLISKSTSHSSSAEIELTAALRTRWLPPQRFGS